MTDPGFVHLHLHSEFSLSDGIIRIEDLVESSVNKKFSAVALTDLSNLFGLIKFYKSARKNGLKPIVGSEVLLIKDYDSLPAPLVLLVKNQTGYTNLTKLVSKAYVEGQRQGGPLVKIEWLAEHSKGLIALSGGQEGHVGQAILATNDKLAESRAEYLKGIFNEDFFIEISRLGRRGEDEYINKVLDIASRKEIPVVATNNVRFLKNTDIEDEGISDFEAHEARVCIQSGEVLDDPRREKKYLESQYLASQEEMQEKFRDIPEAIENTSLIAKKCNLELELGEFSFPDFEVPDKLTTEQYLKEKSIQGLKKKISEIKESENSYHIKEEDYSSRLEYELDMICKLDFAGYFLIVSDFVNWAKDNDIPVGPGRGSGAGSIVAYALGITSIDPLRFDLLFERFLNPDRVSNPDFDIDFCMEGRDRVLEYVTEKYGKDSVAQISTRGTMAARAVLRDVVRVLGKPYGFGDRLAKSIPDVLGISLKEAYKEKDFREVIDSSDESQEVFEMSLKLEGLSRSVGTHAAGVVIAPTALTDFTPLVVDEDKGTVATQFDMGDIESAGLVKFDFLGLKTLTVIHQTVKRINAKSNSREIDIDKLPLDDKKTFELLQEGNTTGVFQFESRGMREYLKQLVPNGFEDLVSMNALYRPGALGMNMVDSYINRKHGKEEVTYGHESVKKILETTYGVIVYQEQVMQIAQELSGFSLGQADILRRAMGKKKKEEMETQRSEFVEGAVKNKVNQRYAQNLFDQIEQFAGYGFNRSHSVGYALIAYQTAWLKAHFPSEFMASMLSCELDSTDRIQMFVEDSRESGLEILKPNINKSNYIFEDIDSKTILYGLGAIKGIGDSLVARILESREESGEFLDLYDFCLRVGSNRVNKRILTALIGSGSMDSLDERETLFNQIESVLRKAEQASERSASNIKDLFGYEENTINDEEIILTNEKYDQLSHEWNSLGFFLNSHPMDNRLQDVRQMCGLLINEIHEAPHPQRLAGMFLYINVRQGRHGRYAFATLDDSNAKIEVSVWAEAFEQYRNNLRKGQLVVVEGIVEKDEYTKGSYKIIANRILTWDQARNEYLSHIKLSLNENKTNIEEITEGLKEISSQEGNPVVIDYSGGEASGEIELPKQMSVTINDENLGKLERLCGNNNIQLVYHSRPSLH
ncbi:MAG: DNA polymerase III subunit alpha [Gammaproteobacteria bacterium]